MAALLLAFQAAPQSDEQIIVTGKKNVTTDYEACLKQKCPPARDANVTLAYAQQQLLAGDYRGSRRALQASIRRNSYASKSHPDAVSALFDADSTVALHFGDQEASRRSGLRAISIVDDAYGRSAPRVIVARARIGAVEERVGRFDDADRAYRAAGEDARAAGLSLLADTLDVRRAAMLERRGQAAAARSKLARIADSTDVHPKIKLQAAVAAARIASLRGDIQTLNRMLGLVGEGSADTVPMLISATPIEADALSAAMDQGEKFGSKTAGDPSSSDYRPILWVDIGYWVRPAGTVEEIQILRGSRTRDWAKKITDSIGTRRYASYDSFPGDPGKYRIERFTLTADWIVPKGSLIRRRAGATKLRTIDITRDPGLTEGI